MRIRSIHVFICFLALILLAGCSSEQSGFEPSGKLVKVGFLGPLSGEEKSLGENSLAGAKVALTLQPYLLNGDKVELVAIDDQDDPQLAKDAIDELLKESEISSLLLGSPSSFVLSMVEYLDKQSIPAVALLATHPGITEGQSIIQLPFDDYQQGTVAALYVMDELIIDKVAVFVDREEVHSSFLAETFAGKFSEAGGVMEVIDCPGSRDELKNILFRLRNTGTQLLYLPVDGSKVIEIEKMCREIGYQPEIMLSDGVLSRILLDHKEDFEIVEGMMACDVFTEERLTRGYGEKVKEVFEANFTAPGTTYTALGVEGMSILLRAMDGCGDSSDRDCINRNLHATSGFTGMNGPISFTPEGKSERPIFINKIVDGKLVFDVMVY